MAKRKMTMIYKTPQKNKERATWTSLKIGVNSGDLEKYVVTAPHRAPVVSLSF